MIIDNIIENKKLIITNNIIITINLITREEIIFNLINNSLINLITKNFYNNYNSYSSYKYNKMSIKLLISKTKI